MKRTAFTLFILSIICGISGVTCIIDNEVGGGLVLIGMGLIFFMLSMVGYLLSNNHH